MTRRRYTQAECDAAAADLAALRAAQMALVTGKSVSRVRLGDHDIEFSAVNADLMARLIRDRNAILGYCNGCGPGSTFVFVPE